jgi:hypothetical protein
MRAIKALAHKTAHPNIGYPYYVSINGSTFTPLICDGFDNSVKLNQTSKASALPFLQGIASSMFGSTMTLDYKAAGLIFSMLAGQISTNSAQWRSGDCFRPTRRPVPIVQTSSRNGV